MRSRLRESNASQIAVGHLLRSGKQMAQAGCEVDRSAEASHQPARKRGGTAHADLLSEDGTHGKFKAVPAARDAQPRTMPDARGKNRMPPQPSADFVGIGGEVEHPANSLDDEEKPAGFGEVNAHAQGVRSTVQGRLKPTVNAMQGDGALVDGACDGFNSGSCARSEEFQQSVPAEWRPEAEQELILMLLASGSAAGKLSQVSRGTVIGFRECIVEATNAAEARSHGDIAHGKSRLVNQLFGKVQPTGLCHCDGTGSKMLQEKAAQVTGSDAEPHRQ